MVKISKQIRKQIEEMGILKVEKGRYKDMYVASRTHKSKSKSFYINDEVYKMYQRRVRNNKNKY